MFDTASHPDRPDPGLVADALDGCRTAADLELDLVSDDDLRQGAIDLEAARAALDAAEGRVLAELSMRDACDRDLGLSTTSWLAYDQHLARPTIVSRLRVAQKLRALLTETSDALAAGRVSFDHARVLVNAANPRIADGVAAEQSQLIELAQELSFGQWQRLVARLVQLWDQDGGHDPADDVARNRLHLNPVGDTLALSGQLVGEIATLVDQVLDAETDAQWHLHRADHDQTPELEIPTRATLRALALAEICRRSQGHEPGQAPTTDITLIGLLADPPTDEPTADASPMAVDPAEMNEAPATDPRRDDPPVETNEPETTAEQLDEPADQGGATDPTDDTDDADLEATDLAGLLAGLGSARAPLAPASPTALLTPTAQLTPPGPPRLAELRTPDGQLLDPQRYAHLLCDPIFRPLLLDGRGTPLALGRSARYATPGQRRALTVRDGGCVFPGCERPPGWCDAHHIIDWHHGGLTDLHVLALLCRHHHTVTHRRGWTMHAQPDGTFIWTTPSGRTLHSTPRLPWTHHHAG